VQRLRQCGVTVQPLSAVGGGVPDILAGYRGRNVLLEIKSPTAPIKQTQKDWHANWSGQVAIVYTWEQAMDAVIGACK
jgi:hypothetical protein